MDERRNEENFAEGRAHRPSTLLTLLTLLAKHTNHPLFMMSHPSPFSPPCLKRSSDISLVTLPWLLRRTFFRRQTCCESNLAECGFGSVQGNMAGQITSARIPDLIPSVLQDHQRARYLVGGYFAASRCC